MKPYNKDNLIASMCRLKEEELIHKIIMPLLDKFSFKWIELRHGNNERGVDILCGKEDEWNDTELLVIQVKRLKYTGAASKSGHLHGVINQISQCLQEPIKLKDGTERLANRVWFVSPYELNISALEVSFGAYLKAYVNRIRIIDGSKLLDVISEIAPEILIELGDKYSLYLNKLVTELNYIQESSAFRVKDKICLSDIFVNGDVDIIPARLKSVLTTTYAGKNVVVSIELSKLEKYIEFGNDCNNLLLLNPVGIIADPTAGKSSKLKSKMIADNKLTAELVLNNTGFYNNLKTIIKQEVDKLDNSYKNNINDIGEKLALFAGFLERLNSILSNDATSIMQKSITSKISHSDCDYRFPVVIDQLLASKLHFQIVGDAGAGKTTLLKSFGLRQASLSSKIFPVFMPLSSINIELSLVQNIYVKCKSYGLVADEKNFDRMLAGGDLIILLDGIDEVTSKVRNLKTQISEFIDNYPKIQTIISTRHWSAIELNKLTNIVMLPFTEDQLRLFYTNWFKGDCKHANEIILHFDKHPLLYNLVSSPLLATVFASVKMMGGNLPTTLNELHEERLRLLLHDWDSIKSVKRNIFSAQDKKFFLKKIAFHLHKNHTRSTTYDNLLKFVVAHIGCVANLNDAVKFIEEMFKVNNMIFQDFEGEWTLGHLQFQEYLAALEAKENPEINLAGYLDDGWWNLVTEFYATMSRDVSSLIYKTYELYGNCLSERTDVLARLLHLTTLAPNTNKKAKGIVEKEIELIDTINASFVEYSDTSILAGKTKW